MHPARPLRDATCIFIEEQGSTRSSLLDSHRIVHTYPRRLLNNSNSTTYSIPGKCILLCRAGMHRSIGLTCYHFYCWFSFAFRQFARHRSFKTKTLPHFVEYHQSHPISSSSLCMYAQFITHYHPLSNQCTCYSYHTINGLHVAICIRRASYSASTGYPHTMRSTSIPLPFVPDGLAISQGELLCTRRKIAIWVVTDII